MASMYGSHADLYDKIYHWKDYASEALRVAALLGAEGVTPGSRLVEVACGTGNHLQHLQHVYRVQGLDLNGPMIEVARQKLPGVALSQADMRDFVVERPADALICLFSSIGYLPDLAALRAAAAAFARAVRPGGALLVEPWLTADAWQEGRPAMAVYDKPDLRLARVSTSGVDGEHAVMDMHWLIARTGQAVEHFVEHHRMWLCPRPVMLGAFADAGFDVRFDPHGLMPDRGLFIGIRRG